MGRVQGVSGTLTDRMKKSAVRHIAIAVRDLEQAKKLFAAITGTAVGQTTEVPDQKVRLCFVETGETRIELISPLEGNVSLTKFLDTRGECLHHICLGVPDIESALQGYRQRGFRLVDEKPRRGAEGHKIAFLHPASTGGVLIELEETD